MTASLKHAKLHRTVWRIPRVTAALLFSVAGAFKLAGAESMVGLFAMIGWGQWFRFVTGGLELLGAALLLRRRTAIAGAVLLAFVAAGATMTHLTLIGGSPVPAILLLALTIGIAAATLRSANRWFVGKY